MSSGSDKWIRSIKDNPAGKVVSDTDGNRWQWQSADDTSLQLKKLNNDELAIEQTDLYLRPEATEPPKEAAGPTNAATIRRTRSHPLKKAPKRDAGGGFNPYDSGTPKRR